MERTRGPSITHHLSPSTRDRREPRPEGAMSELERWADGLAGLDPEPYTLEGEPTLHGFGLVEGTLVSFDSGTYRATITTRGTNGGTFAGVPVSRGLPSANLVVGARILVWAPHSEPSNYLVVAVA